MDVGEISRTTANDIHLIENARNGRYIQEMERAEKEEELRASIEDIGKRRRPFSIFRDADEESPGEVGCIKIAALTHDVIAKTESPLEDEHG